MDKEKVIDYKEEYLALKRKYDELEVKCDYLLKQHFSDNKLLVRQKQEWLDILKSYGIE
jgi:hypothetical protein